ncbi:Non-ribosomal peptide synthetase component F, partial [Duganella sp. CF458]
LTAARFINTPEGRLYKSGDLGRWLADGSIDYLGRNDFQVKIRGFRIELGEIEAKLAACDGVREAVVLAREDQPGDKRLVAYVVPKTGVSLEAATLRATLLADLAEYMVPGAYVMLDEFPLTANGKLDRKALPAPDESALSRREYEAPQGEVETALAELWQELLGVERIGRRDHFFELGGHSLLVVKVIERIRQLGWNADVRSVFSTPVLADLALALQDKPAATQAVAVPKNLIEEGCTHITPDMLPLVSLGQFEIDRIAETVAGGAANVADIYPLAPLQAGILFHHMLDTEGDPYLLRSTLTFASRERMESFLSALQRVIDRHDILRTAIVWEGMSAPAQVVYRQAELPLLELKAGSGDALADLLANTDPRRCRLNLTRAPLMTANACEDAASGEWHMALLYHHIVSDHVTLEFIIGEVQALMQDRADLLPVPVPYRNFIAHTLAIDPQAQEAYFREKLGDIVEPTAPFGLLDVQGDGSGAREAHSMLDPQLSARLRRVARSHGATPAVLFHAAWARVLSACTGQDDVVFGTVLLGRLQSNEDNGKVLGMFVNSLPVRSNLRAASVQELVDGMRSQLSALFEHEQASLTLAQRCSGIDAQAPLFTTLLNYRHSHVTRAGDQAEFDQAWQGIRMLAGEERINYPIGVNIDDLGEDLAVTAQCDGVEPERITDMLLEAVAQLMDALEHAPSSAALGVNVLPESERSVIEAFELQIGEFEDEFTIHGRFEEQAAAQPDAIALTVDGQQMTYEELNSNANRMAHRLLELGVQPDDRVAICAERGFGMIAGLLAIMKAGAGYVPLDPVYPDDRLAFMLGDCAPRVVLADSALASRLDVGAASLMLLDDDFGAQPAHNPVLEVSPSSLAYVIYTSGSTGLPKGVMIEHRNVARLLTATGHWFGFGPSDVWTLFHSFAFDFSVWEIWGALLTGGRLVVVPYLASRAPQEFY